ncbi:hypothetical protein HFQ13_10830 [Acidithiobacillus sp. VAN18-1]|uniref:DUF6969 domain-containing protein n=1 Tax=Igneacidithiobacillus copahuensis TaxID=2724909 RepID=A0AAE2YRY3_9PROT|nr:hypothetical protein [Igneacidithiobacillus copahuensis]
MRRAARVVEQVTNALDGCGVNVVADILRGHEPYITGEHYPPDDAQDATSGCRFYYHAHDADTDEHGHFHPFVPLRGKGNDEELIALPAISMDVWGRPRSLFTVNHWVTGGPWLSGPATLRAMRRFRMEQAYPSWLVNRWITAMYQLVRPHVERLLLERDAALQAAARRTSLAQVFSDREKPVVTWMPIDQTALAVELRNLCHLADQVGPIGGP